MHTGAAVKHGATREEVAEALGGEADLREAERGYLYPPSDVLRGRLVRVRSRARESGRSPVC